MAVRFVSVDHDTPMLLPPDFRDWVPADHIVHFVMDAVKLLDLTAKARCADGRKQRKKVLREMKSLEKRIARHARAHVGILKTRREETDLTQPQAQLIINRIGRVLDQFPAAIKQAHERIIGGRQVSGQDKILSLYDDNINVIKRGKAGAQVEFGNKLWPGETREGVIVDYQFHQDTPTDSALVKPALTRPIDQQGHTIGQVWGDRGLASKPNTALLAVGWAVAWRKPGKSGKRMRNKRPPRPTKRRPDLADLPAVIQRIDIQAIRAPHALKKVNPKDMGSKNDGRAISRSTFARIVVPGGGHLIPFGLPLEKQRFWDRL